MNSAKNNAALLAARPAMRLTAELGLISSAAPARFCRALLPRRQDAVAV